MTPLAYTRLRVTSSGVVLYEHHLVRFASAGPIAMAAFARFARSAPPGIYSVIARADGLQVTQHAGPRLVEGLPVRVLPTPLQQARGPIPKPPAPSPYDAVRASGVISLLTSPDGAELYEADAAALVGWDGERYVVAPRDRPRVEATSEAELRARLNPLERPLPASDSLPLVLLNAVTGPCRVALAHRAPFPDERFEALADLVERSARRPPEPCSCISPG